jgi:predicted DNA-binding transcriptional regulator AlpA
MNAGENDETENPVGLDNSGGSATIEGAGEAVISSEMVMSLGKYRDDDYITKVGLAKVFGCTDRTLQRMVERLELPPPMLLAGRKVWIVGKLRAWIAKAAERQEAEALKAAGRLRTFDT